MARDAAEEIGRDRVMDLVARNPSLGRVLLGLTKQFARICDERGIAPEGLRFEVPHLDATGRLRFRYRFGSRGRCAYRGAFGLDAVEWLHASNSAAGAFLHRCRSWRTTIEGIYERAARFAGERELPFDSLEFGFGRIAEDGRRAWLEVYGNRDAKTRAELAAARR